MVGSVFVYIHEEGEERERKKERERERDKNGDQKREQEGASHLFSSGANSSSRSMNQVGKAWLVFVFNSTMYELVTQALTRTLGSASTLADFE